MNNRSTIFSFDVNNFNTHLGFCESNVAMPYIIKYLPKGEKILEAGCGLGHIVKYLSQKGYDISGVEINSEVVNGIKSIYPEIDIVVGDVSDLKFKDDYFGGIISLGVIEHFIDGPEKALKEMYRVLKPGGTAVVSVPLFNKLRFMKKITGIVYLDFFARIIFHKYIKKIPKETIGFSHKNKSFRYNRWPVLGNFFEYRMTRKQFTQQLEDAGFNIIEEDAVDSLAGLYHELGGVFVNLNKPSKFIKILEKVFLLFPFFHHHMILCVVRKNDNHS